MSTRSDEILRNEGLNVISQSLYKEIYNELPTKIRDRRRWVWELMQNAKDVIKGEGYVEITLTDKAVTFAHNGSPFTYDNLAAILSQRTSKAPDYTDDQKQSFFDKIFSGEEIDNTELERFLKTSGRFGSGFMTTYLLSKKIELKSLYTDGEKAKEFSLSLDRSVEIEKDLINKVKESFDCFSEIEEFKKSDIIIDFLQNPAKCYTRFTYTFEDESSKDIATEGIEDLHASIGLVFCFVDLFEQVTITEEGISTIYKRLVPKMMSDVSIIKFSKSTGSETEIQEIVKVSAKHNVTSIALPIKTTVDGIKLSVPHTKTPFQFISFPLIGSESFSFPVIINSPLFNPGDHRDKVHLNLTTEAGYNKKVSLNRQLLEKCLELYKVIVDHAIDQKWGNLHYLAKTAIPAEIELPWYKDSVQSTILKVIEEAPIVKPHLGGKNIQVRAARFPVYNDEKMMEFWKLATYLIGEQIPNEDDAPLWKKFITENKQYWEHATYDFGLEDLLGLITTCGTMETFIATYFAGNTTEAYKVLNEIIRFTENENKDLLDRHEDPFLIVPSQQGQFTEKKKLRRDKGWPERLIPKPIKDVLKTMGNNWYEKLVKDEITCFESTMTRSVREASERVKVKVEKYLLKSVIKETDVEELQSLENFKTAMFELIGFYGGDDSEHQSIFDFAKKLFPAEILQDLTAVTGAEDFDWASCKRWLISSCLEKVASFENMNVLCYFLNKNEYPDHDDLTDDEQATKFITDGFLNDLISFAFTYNNNFNRFLETYAVIPNQKNELMIYGVDLYNDTYKISEVVGVPDSSSPIPKRLKQLVSDLGEDAGEYLLHEGVSLKMPAARDTEYLCGVADRLILQNRDSSDVSIKNAIRELDKWIALNIEDYNRALYFGRFYEKRHSIVLNTYTPEERNHVDQILKSGQSAALAKISQKANSAETINKIADLVANININEVMSVLEAYPDITLQRMQHLLHLEELSKGLKTDVNYTPEDKQIVKNFETGYKGEAYIFKQLKQQGIAVEWTNQSLIPTETSVIDDEGLQHYIDDKKNNYDLIATTDNNEKVYIQVKATTTDIQAADLIALPISASEWKFLGKTVSGESFYLVRVFNIGNGPKPYYLRMGDQLLK
jgi:hypothetical protein